MRNRIIISGVFNLRAFIVRFNLFNGSLEKEAVIQTNIIDHGIPLFLMVYYDCVNLLLIFFFQIPLERFKPKMKCISQKIHVSLIYNLCLVEKDPRIWRLLLATLKTSIVGVVWLPSTNVDIFYEDPR